MQITQKQSCQDLQNLILNHKSLKMTQVLLQTLQNPRKMKQKQMKQIQYLKKKKNM